MEKYRAKGRMEADKLAKSEPIAPISTRSYAACRRLMIAKHVMRLMVKEPIKWRHHMGASAPGGS
jgi:hypothetical protein